MAGTGLERVPDAGVAKQILDRVNSMNVSTSLKALAVTVLFASAAFLDPLARQACFLFGTTKATHL